MDTNAFPTQTHSHVSTFYMHHLVTLAFDVAGLGGACNHSGPRKNSKTSSSASHVYYPIEIRSVISFVSRCMAAWNCSCMEENRAPIFLQGSDTPLSFVFVDSETVMLRTPSYDSIYLFRWSQSDLVYVSYFRGSQGYTLPSISWGWIMRERSPRFMDHNVSHWRKVELKRFV